MQTNNGQVGSVWQRAAASLLLLAFLSAHGAAAQSDVQAKWNATVAKAKEEGKVVVWGPGGTLVQRANAEFEKDFPGIKIELAGGRGTSMGAKLNAERQGGIYSVDVFINGPTTANFDLKPVGTLDPIKPVLMLPDATDPKGWLDGHIQYSDKEQAYDIVFTEEVSPQLIYNAKLAKLEDVNSLQKLLDPKLKGKVLTNDPSVTGSGVPWFRQIWVGMGPEKAIDYYRKLYAQLGPNTRDTRIQVEWIAQGKYAVLTAASSSSFQQLMKSGVKFEVLSAFTDSKQMVGSSTGTMSLVNKAPHPNAAAVYINWALTRKGQMLWQNAIGIPSRRVDVPKDGIPDYQIPKAGVDYFMSFTEENQTLDPKEQDVITELFGR
jgi:iron(III) transport system substrate-binding protein